MHSHRAVGSQPHRRANRLSHNVRINYRFSEHRAWQAATDDTPNVWEPSQATVAKHRTFLD